MQRILIATLGEYPTVISGMIKALESKGIELDLVYILHTQNDKRHIDGMSVEWIQEYTDTAACIRPIPLPFADPHTKDDSLLFLREVATVMENHVYSQHEFYLSIAGGRKNMSALLALMSQFYPSIQGVFHLLDQREDTRQSIFYTSEELVDIQTPEKLKGLFNPAVEYLELINIPCPKAFGEADQLRTFLKQVENDQSVSPVELSTEAEIFYRTIYGSIRSTELRDVWLSQKAYNRYKALGPGNIHARDLHDHFERMRYLPALKQGIHATSDDLHFFKRRRTPERPLFYTTPNPIHLYPQKPVDKVIIVDIAIEREKKYSPPTKELLTSIDRKPYKNLTELKPQVGALVVPLGKSPMVATQLYTLLQNSGTEGISNIPTIALVYPQVNGTIQNSARLLKNLFKQKGVQQIYDVPIAGIKDVDSEEACKKFAQKLCDTVRTIKQDHPEQSIALSISGGRKGMSALTLFAAQIMEIDHVYHTLITGVEIERKVQVETSYSSLKTLSDEEKKNRLFLGRYDIQNFSLLRIPVIPLIRKS